MAVDEQAQIKLWQEARNAIDMHDAARIRSLVSEGLDINSRSPITGHSDATLLMIAAWDETNSEIVQLLIELGADVNAEAHCGNALTRAKGYRNIKLLLDRGANPNIPTKTDKGKALLYHSEDGNADIVKLLIEHGADIYADWDRIGIGYKNVFSSALSNGHLNVIEVLLDALHKKAEQNDINWPKLNWLELAIEHGDNNSINRLFSIVVSNRESASRAVTTALENNNYDLAKKLFQHGAIPDEYAVNEAVLDGDWKRVDFLMKNGGKIRADNLPEAAEKGDMKVVMFLLKHGANIDEESKYDGSTALHYSVREGHLDIVNALLKKGASTNIVNWKLRDDKTPLMTALWQLHENRYEGETAKTYLQIIEALLKAGADPHFMVKYTDSDGLPYERSASELVHVADDYENEVKRLFDKYSRRNESRWSLFGILKKKK
ncbi:MAG: ankyrin repeat domain-containing protein [Nitrospirota bacterium]